MFKSLLKKAGNKARDRINDKITQRNETAAQHFASNPSTSAVPQPVFNDNIPPLNPLDFSNFSVARPIGNNPWSLCEPCSAFGFWLDRSLKTNRWEPYQAGNWATPNEFHLGFLDQMLATDGCSLCRLLANAIWESFNEIPTSYDGHGGRKFRQQISIDASSLFKQTTAYEDFGLEITLSGFGSSLKMTETILKNRNNNDRTMRFAARVLLVEEDINQIPAPLYHNGGAGKLTPNGGCDLVKLVQAYQICTHQHGAICEIPRHEEIDYKSPTITTLPTIEGFRLIDVQNMRIINAPTYCRYVALSYVWGKDKFVTLTKFNHDLFKQAGSLQNQALPRTVREAIELTAALGEDYLWVDALCIIQDDDVSKVAQITQMDKIYLSAALTIVAADGAHANAGLTGFTPGSRTLVQNVETIAGLRFISLRPPILKSISQMKWHTRAWTYQEYMLSKRKIFFTDQQVFYFCNLTTYSEDSMKYIRPPPPGEPIEEDPYSLHPLRNIDEHNNLNIGREFRYEQNFFAYINLVRDINTRDITTDADILRSVTGILGAMKLFRDDSFICGLPASMLEWALFWQPDGELTPRGNTYHGHEFPSWSWIGWKGTIKYPEHYLPSKTRSLITDWEFWTPSPTTRELLPYHPVSRPKNPNWALTPWLGLFTDSTETTFLYPDHQSQLSNLDPLIESGFLQFHAASAVFPVEISPLPNTYRYKSFSHSVFRILDDLNTENWVGTLNLGPWNPEFATASSATVQAELIAVSMTNSCHEYVPGPNYGQNTFQNRTYRPLKVGKGSSAGIDGEDEERLLVNVLWIKWVEDGNGGRVAKRVGAGQVHFDAWRERGAVRKLIWLG